VQHGWIEEGANYETCEICRGAISANEVSKGCAPGMAPCTAVGGAMVSSRGNATRLLRVAIQWRMARGTGLVLALDSYCFSPVLDFHPGFCANDGVGSCVVEPVVGAYLRACSAWWR
jgi:hypothetical protein